ncbi:MAG: hypothetical protein ABL958_16630, partial [Bdellovibrionia bacterium]
EDMVTMTVGGVPSIRFRNYLYGRAIGWNTGPTGFGKLFPGTTDVARARRIIGETRGARFLANNMMVWVK